MKVLLHYFERNWISWGWIYTGFCLGGFFGEGLCLGFVHMATTGVQEGLHEDCSFYC